MLAGRDTSLNVPFNEINEGHLEQAKENIRNHFILVGLTERYNESLLLLKNILSWKTPIYSRANAVKRDKKTTQFYSQLKNLIIEYNQIDFQLYDYVSVLFDEQIEKHPMIYDELVKFELKNKFGGKFQIGARIKRKISKWAKN